MCEWYVIHKKLFSYKLICTCFCLKFTIFHEKSGNRKHYLLPNRLVVYCTSTYVYCTLSLHTTRKILFIYCTLDTVQYLIITVCECSSVNTLYIFYIVIKQIRQKGLVSTESWIAWKATAVHIRLYITIYKPLRILFQIMY